VPSYAGEKYPNNRLLRGAQKRGMLKKLPVSIGPVGGGLVRQGCSQDGKLFYQELIFQVGLMHVKTDGKHIKSI
jgi:hypothetical protein